MNRVVIKCNSSTMPRNAPVEKVTTPSKRGVFYLRSLATPFARQHRTEDGKTILVRRVKPGKSSLKRGERVTDKDTAFDRRKRAVTNCPVPIPVTASVCLESESEVFRVEKLVKKLLVEKGCISVSDVEGEGSVGTEWLFVPDTIYKKCVAAINSMVLDEETTPSKGIATESDLVEIFANVSPVGKLNF